MKTAIEIVEQLEDDLEKSDKAADYKGEYAFAYGYLAEAVRRAVEDISKLDPSAGLTEMKNV